MNINDLKESFILFTKEHSKLNIKSKFVITKIATINIALQFYKNVLMPMF